MMDQAQRTLHCAGLSKRFRPTAPSDLRKPMCFDERAEVPRV